MVVFQVGRVLLDVGDVVVVVIHREQGVVGVDVDAIGGSGLHRDGRGDLPFGTQLHTEAALVDARHDEVDVLAGVGVFAGGGVLEDVLAIEATVPDEVLIGVVVTRQAELEHR